MNTVPSTHTSLLISSTDTREHHRQNKRSKRGGCKYPFPQRLFDLLEEADNHEKEPELSSIISWNPNGKHFRIHNRKEFEKAIQKKYFDQSKYASFRRQLNLWGFERIPDQKEEDSLFLNTRSSSLYGGCYFHPLFQRSNRSLCNTMSRVVGSDGIKKLRTPVSISNGDNVRTNTSFNSASFSSSLPSPSYLLGDNFDPTVLTLLQEMNSSSIGLCDTRQNEAMIRGDELLVIEDQKQQHEHANVNTASSFSCRNANDNQFQLLINFLSINDDHINNYLFEK